MDQHQHDFIDFLYRSGMLVLSTRTLRSGRISPYFVNMDPETGEAQHELGMAYAGAIMQNFPPDSFDVLYGPAYKGISIANSAAQALSEKFGVNKYVAFNRKEAKPGEGALLGHRISAGERVLMLDDVFTTGDTKVEGLNIIAREAPGSRVIGLLIGVDRQELDVEGRNAIKAFSGEYSVPVKAVVTVEDLVESVCSRGKADSAFRSRVANYLNRFGVNYVQERVPIVGLRRSIIPACDVPTLQEFEDIVRQTTEIQKIGGYKIGRTLEGRFGLQTVVGVARNYTDKPIIWDGQKHGSDIDTFGSDVAAMALEAGVNAVIIFPESGPVTQYKWTQAIKDAGIKVIVGGEMTHPGFLKGEGGSMDPPYMDEVYRRAVFQGVTDFVVPGNKPDRLAHYNSMMADYGIVAVYYSPGFIAQGGQISDAANILRNNFHTIVGRAIYEPRNKKQAALELAATLEKFEESLKA